VVYQKSFAIFEIFLLAQVQNLHLKNGGGCFNIRVVNITLIHDKKYCKNLVLERCPAGGCGNDAPERSVSQGALWRSRDRHSANFLPGYFWGMGSIFGLMDRLGRVRGRVRRRAGERV
jgi:hypothetical protein